MEEIEIEGKSIDEAIEKACSAFQVPREKLNIEINCFHCIYKYIYIERI